MLPSLFSLFPLLGSTYLFPSANAQVTVHGQIPLAQTRTLTDTAGAPQPTLAAYNNTELIPPPLPNPPPGLGFVINLQREAATVSGLSIPHVGPAFWGFSIEMSVLTQVLGKNSSHIGVPFLNLMANLQERAGGVYIRIGGNTQEFAVMVEEDSSLLRSDHTFGKTDSGTQQTTQTPAVLYTIDMFYIASNISALVNVKWFLGVPFNDTSEWRTQIAEYGQEILGDNLLGLQAGNEPDLYEMFQHRVAPYTPMDYMGEVNDLLAYVDTNDRLPRKNIFIGPSIATKAWTPEQVWETGFIDHFKDRFYCFTVENYPFDNCAAQFNTGRPHVNVQELFPYYLNHDNMIEHVGKYRNTGLLVQQTGKPLIMFETNTGSCGGFMGISDSFAAALWSTDYGFQLAFSNFTHGLLHVGGQNAYYNPFTSPPTNQSAFNQWTVGAVYYSTIVLAEAFGKTNTSRIVDLMPNQGSIYTPAYAIYENEVLNKVALFNYMDDLQTGTHAINVVVNIPGAVPSSVRVKYLASHSVSSKNITWAGQTLGPQLTVDGRFRGELDVVDVPCDAAAGTCTIRVPAPGFALVFLDTSNDVLSLGQATQTFATSAYTRVHNTAFMDPSDVAKSNGHSAKNRDGGLGSTSLGSVTGAGRQLWVPRLGILTGLGLGGWGFMRVLRR